MADRYLRATGNWNGPVWAETSGGTAGSAATPTASDNVYIAANFTVTLTADAACGQIYHTNGRLNLSSYKLTSGNTSTGAGYLESTGSTIRTLDLGTGTLVIVGRHDYEGAALWITGTNMDLIAGSSLVIIDAIGNDGVDVYVNDINIGSKALNDVRVNMGVGSSDSAILNITGSPTFRSLIIQSKNSAAHTVSIDGGVTADRFIFIGSSAGSKMTIEGSGEFVQKNSGAPLYEPISTIYGQFLHMKTPANSFSTSIAYIGSNSTQDIAPPNNPWLLQDPPKISTLIDPLTTAPGSNSNWTVDGTVNTRTDGLGGGGYSGTSGAEMVSTDTYDLIGSKLIFERPVATPTGDSVFGVGTGMVNNPGDVALYSETYDTGAEVWELAYTDRYSISGSGYSLYGYPITNPKYIRIEVATNGYFTIAHSDDGLSWTTANDGLLDEIEMLMLRSARIKGTWQGVSHIGSINMLPSYPLIEAFSAEDPGFSGTDPYNSGSAVTYTVQQTLTANTDHYWRVRAMDPSGSGEWGEWSEVRKIVTEQVAPTVTTGSATSVSYTSATVAGNVTSDGGAAISQRGIVYSTSTNPTTSSSKVTATGTTGAFTANLSGLTDNTTYYARAYAINSKGTSYGSQISFTTLDITTASVSTTSPSAVSYTSATVGGNVTNANGATVTERGVVYATTTNPTTSNTKVQVGSGTGSFSTNLTSLADGTTFYVRAYAINSQGTAYGTQQSFTTTAITTPTITSSDADQVQPYSARVTGNVTNANGATVTERGFVYGLSANPTTADTKIVVSGTTGSYNTVLSGLTDGTQYNWRAYAINSKGTAYSTNRVFTTVTVSVPTVTSNTVTGITTESATVGGNVTSANNGTLTERGVVYSTSPNPTTANTKVQIGNGTGSFSTSLSLTSNTTYYLRAYAINEKGAGYGVERTFTTEPLPPLVSTGTASGMSIDSINVTGSGVTSNPDSQTIDEYGVVYSTSPNPTISNSKQVASGGSGNFNVELTGLSEDTTYYIRAYAQWRGSDHAYGSQVSFKTQGRPVITLDTLDGLTEQENRPQLKFTGVDPDNDDITYRIQLSTASDFSSTVYDRYSSSDAGFVDISSGDFDPFSSGDQIGFTPTSDLDYGVLYYWRVQAKDPSGSDTWSSWTSSRSFTVKTILPTVTISSAYGITFSEASVDAEALTDGGAPITERGVVYSTSENPTTADDKITSGTGLGEFSVQIENLDDTTRYYVRAYAINSVGTVYSSQISILTEQTPAPPTVVTGAPMNITANTVQVTDSEVLFDGTQDVYERGVVFGLTANPDIDDSRIVDLGVGLGTYTLGITGLDPSTAYHMRSYAINSLGVGYGEDVSFTTDAPYVPDEGDGYWTWSYSNSSAIIGRSQATLDYSSADLKLNDLNLTESQAYTFYYASATTDNGEVAVMLEWYDDGVKQQMYVDPAVPHTFTYDEVSDYTIRLFVTQADLETEPINAIFSDMYLAQESEFSGYVAFERHGIYEIKLENNWLVDQRRENVISSIFGAIEGIGWNSFKAKTTGIGYLEVGDLLTIEDDNSNQVPVIIWEKTLTIDGGISEDFISQTPDKTEIDYSKAGQVTRGLRRTQISVDKNEQLILSLASDVYDVDGVVNERFTEVEQTIESVKTTVQSSGGINLVKNSVMYAFNDQGVPDKWGVAGTGTLTIQASLEPISFGGISGNMFTLSGETVSQEVQVRKDLDSIPDDLKQYYSFSALVKKNTVGNAWIKLSNRNDEPHIINLPDQEGFQWAEVSLEELLPSDDHYTLEIYSDADADLQVTDVMLSPGEGKRQWTQANGEAMNTSFSITDDGVTVRSNVFKNDYTRQTALGFEVHKHEAGGEEIFGFNGDETNMRKARVDDQISMAPLRIVPVDYNGYKGWAFTLSNNNE